MSFAPPTVFVVDDDPAVRKSLARLLRASGWDVATFGSAQEFLEQHDPRAPGCLVLDLAMPGVSGLELQEALARKESALPIVFLTGRGDIPMSVQAMKHGALDFLTKPVKDAELLEAIRIALEKNRDARQDRAELDEVLTRLATLTPREREVLERVVTGRLNKQIADELGTVEQTIKVHRGRVMQKMKVGSVADLVRLVERARSAGH